MRISRASALLALAVAAAGCEAEARLSATVVQDSAGVRLVTHTSGAREVIPFAGPTLTIGREDDPQYQFDRVRLVAPLDDGRILVANGGSHELRLYSPQGELLRAAGREGDGPGEFRSLDRATLLPGGVIVADDIRARRVTLWSAELEPLERIEYAQLAGELPKGAGPCQEPLMVGALSADLLVFTGWICWTVTGTEGVQDIRVELYLWNARTGERRALGPFSLSSVYERVGVPVQEQYTPLSLFGMTPFLAAGDELLVGSREAHRIRAYRADGTLRMTILDEVPRHAVDEAFQRAEAARIAAGPESSRARLAALPLPDSLPALDRLIAGDAQIWARHVAPRDAKHHRWSAYSQDGARVGTFELPSTFTPHSVSGGVLWGVGRDAFGVERVEAWPASASTR